MYAIRVDESRGLLRVDLSGRLTTSEALRAVSQASTLAEAGNLHAVLCDLSAVRRGPGGLLLVAAALAARYRAGMRIAFVAPEPGARLAERFTRFTGLGEAVALLPTAPAAEAFLAPAIRKPPRMSQTEIRHARQVLGEQLAPAEPVAGARRAEPAA